MSTEDFVSSKGEEGNKRGTEFESSMSYLLSRMGYETTDQNFNIECSFKEEHKKKEHGVDILIKKPFNTYFPFKIPNAKNFIISCKSSEGGKIQEGEVIELINSVKCYQKEVGSEDVGGILITTGNFSLGAQTKLINNNEVKGWDLKYIIFLSVLVSNYGNRLIKKLYIDDYTYIIFNPMIGLPKDIMIFYDAETPLNVDKIKNIIRKFSKKFWTKFGIYKHVEFHSLNGYTADVYDFFDKYSWRVCGFSLFKIRPSLFINYKFPWDVILKFDLIYPSYWYKTYKNIKLR